MAKNTRMTVWIAALSAAAVAAHSITAKMEPNPMPIPTNAICVGRLSIGLPKGAAWQFRGAALEGFDIWIQPEGEADFERRLNARVNELTHPAVRAGSKTKPLELQRPFAVGGYVGTLLVAERTTDYLIEDGKKVWSTTVRVEAYARLDGFSIDISTRYLDPKDIERPLQLLAQLVLNPGNTLPDEPGFCIGNAYFREPLRADQNERVSLLVGMAEHPDLTLLLDSTVGADIPAEDLLARHAKWKESISVLDRMRITEINQKARTIHDFPGQESLTRYREHNHTSGFNFSWESRAVPGNVLRPALYLEMRTGVNPQSGGAPVESTLSQEEALNLWQTISSSVRLRSAIKTPPAQEPPAVGVRASAGSSCPRSGWWECSEDGGTLPIAGGRRRHFAEGNIFPQADVLAPQTFWEKVKGHQTTFQSKYPTVWKLVQLDAHEDT